MSSAAATPKTGRKTETRLAKKEVPLSVLMRQRAHQQFASVKAGEGPIPSGQVVQRPKVALVYDANPANSANKGTPPRVAQTLKSKPSMARVGNDESQQKTSVASQPTMMRTRPSMSNLRSKAVSDNTLHTRSPNMPASPTTTGKDARTAPVMQENVSSVRRQAVAASPILSALIKSGRNTKRIGFSASHESERTATSPNIISGGGIKVKSTPSPVKSRPDRSSPTLTEPIRHIKIRPQTTPKALNSALATHNKTASAEGGVVRMRELPAAGRDSTRRTAPASPLKT